MNYLKLCSILVAIFIFSAHTVPFNLVTAIPQLDCELLQEFNTTVGDKLKLTGKQSDRITEINKSYLRQRRIIAQTPNMIGQHTALLATWDQWMEAMNPQLNSIQQKALYMWQTEVDILSESPF